MSKSVNVHISKILENEKISKHKNVDFSITLCYTNWVYIS